MNLLSAIAFLFACSLKNRARRQVVRLRQPRYLIATALGGFYFYTLFVRRLFVGNNGPSPLDESTILFLEVPVLALALLTVVATWVLGTPQWALAFSEAEVQFLFPGPLSRRALLHFRVAKTVLRTAFSAGVMALLSGGLVTGSRWLYFLGLWLAISTMSLHATGAALVQFSWRQRGGFRWPVRALLGIALGGLLGGAVWVAVQEVPFPERWTPQLLGTWLELVLSSAPLGWLLWPLRAPLHLALARDLSGFWAALPAALAVFGVHYAWVVTRQSVFEEAALKGTEQRREWRNLASPTRVVPGGKLRRPFFKLGGEGRAEVAILWKNLIGMRRLGSARSFGGLIALALVGVTAALSFTRGNGADSPVWMVAALIAAITAVLVTLFGSTSVRADFRQDLQQLDILRATPLSGWQLALGQVSAPLVVLVFWQWVALALAVTFASLAPTLPVERAHLLAGAAALAVIGPGLLGGGLLIQNAIALLFPDWISADPQERGLEVVGQRLLAFVGSWLALLLGVLPAALVGGLVGGVLLLLLPSAGAALLAAAAAALVLAFEFVGGVVLLGKLVDRLDPSQ